MPDAPSSGSFTADGPRWRFDGTLTFDDATQVLASATALPLPASGVVDLGGLTHADSSALAVLLALRRRATTEGTPLAFTAMPATLDALARVYGIETLLAA